MADDYKAVWFHVDDIKEYEATHSQPFHDYVKNAYFEKRRQEEKIDLSPENIKNLTFDAVKAQTKKAVRSK